jgi:hypothetical protein
MLYQFEILDRKLDEWGFPKLKGVSGFQIIKGIDFEEAYKSGSISFEDDGIYLEYEGKKYRGYMFIQEAYITYNGGPAKFPKFHLLKCRIIQEFIDSGRFKQRYEWSNSDVNNLIDKQTRIKYNDKKLELCSYCQSDYFEEIEDTQDFFDSLDKSVIEENNIEVDIFGYTREWQKISRSYRVKRNFTCESCGIKIDDLINRRYLHTHHKNGDKTNNRENNLECLCILCHSFKDIKHEENFDKKRMLNEIKVFVKIYREQLELLKNQFLKRYDIEHKK